MTLKEEFLEWLTSQTSSIQQIGEEYIAETEHQEGEEFIEIEFSNLDDIIKDFELYVENINE